MVRQTRWLTSAIILACVCASLWAGGFTTLFTPRMLGTRVVPAEDASGLDGGGPGPRGASLPAAAAEFHVAPDGNDANPGTAAAPFRTVARAQAAVRDVAGSVTGEVVVWLRGGTYPLSAPLEFTAADGGTATPTSAGSQVSYRAYPGETPWISGGRRVTGWTPGADGIWSAPSPVADCRQLYVNDRRATRARGPADFILTTTGDGHAVVPGTIETWGNLRDVEFVYRDIWTLPRVRPYRVWKDFLYMQQPAYAQARQKSDSQRDPPVWVENARELLDEPGEWYLDKSAGVVYYYPRPGEDMPTAEVVVPALEVLVSVTGTAGAPVRALAFEGVGFEHGSWLQPNAYGTCAVAKQANVIIVGADDDAGGVNWRWEMSPGNVVARHATALAFTNCTFTRLGTAGLHLRAGVTRSHVVGCTFRDLSGSGVQVGEVRPTGNASHPDTVDTVAVVNNYITNCCVEFRSGVGLFGGYVRNARFEHNTISNLPYTGISLGWGWSPRETEAANNSVAFNHIYAIMTYLRDGGGIYTLSTQPGTNVSYNVIHDSGWNGLYPDERTNGTTWSYNVVWDADNAFLDHSMYDEPHWNAVHHNYLETYPTNLGCWYPSRDANQTFGLHPGDPGFPADIVTRAGVEPAYQHLLPADEWHWEYVRGGGENPLATAPATAIVVGVLVAGVGVAGVLWLLRDAVPPGEKQPREASP